MRTSEHCRDCGDQLDLGVCGNHPRCKSAPCAELREAIYVAQDYAAGVDCSASRDVILMRLRQVSRALLAEMDLPDASGNKHESGT